MFVDLGFAPLANAYLSEADLNRPERSYPLRLYVCRQCWLVQTEDHAWAGELFGEEYAYFSSVSSSWVAHAVRYVATITRRLELDRHRMVVEVACNDGYLLEHFVAAGIPCLGIEPTASAAAVARARNVPVVEDFFGAPLARKLVARGIQADLVVANNVLAHVPDINEFVAGFAVLLKPQGMATFEFPHLLRLVADAQFDTIYHEHFSYLSLTVVDRIFTAGGLTVVDVEEHPTHGGSLRVFAQRRDTGPHARSAAVEDLLQREARAGVLTPGYYAGFQTKADAIKNQLLGFLLAAKRRGKTVGAYGAAAKGSTLLNYAGVRPDLLPFVCDAAPLKRGKYMPGSHIPIVPPAALRERKPDIVLILPWNIADEVVREHGYIREWGGRFAVALPAMKVLPTEYHMVPVLGGTMRGRTTTLVATP